MKRCSNCHFPNRDSDLNCFKCGTALPDEPVIESHPSDLEPSPTFDAKANVTTFIHTPTESPHPETQEAIAQTEEEACITSVPAQASAPTQTPPPPTTKAPTLSNPVRILPKYKSLNLLGMASKCLGTLLGIVFIGLSISCLLMFPNIFSTAVCILGVCFGIIQIVLGFILAAVLNWLNDVECNQRKQQELLNHIYHKLP